MGRSLICSFRIERLSMDFPLPHTVVLPAISLSRTHLGLSLRRQESCLGSREKWNPTSAHPAHVFCILGVGTQEILLDQALHGNEPKHT